MDNRENKVGFSGKLRNLLDNRIVKNAGWLIFGRVVQMFISLIVNLLTARYLGPSNYGLINYAAAYTGFFASLCNLGLNSVLVKEFIDNPEQEGTIIGTSLVLRAVSSFLSAVTIICIVFVADAGESTVILVVGLSCIGMFFRIFDTFNYWFQSRLQSKVTAIVTLVAYVITAIYRVLLVVQNKSVFYFSLATAVDYLCVGVLLWLSYRKYNGDKLRVSWKYSKTILKKSYHFILPAIMTSIYAQADKFMLKQMVNETEVGYYSTAVTVVTLWCFVIAAVIDSIYPTLLEAYKKRDGTFRQKNVMLYRLVFYVCLLVSAMYVILAKPIILILYGAEYLPAVEPLRIVTWYNAFSYLGVARQAWVVCNDKQKYLIYIYVLSALINVLLNAVFIPAWGASGAALASLITQISTILVPYLIKDMRENTKMMLEAIFLTGLFNKKDQP